MKVPKANPVIYLNPKIQNQKGAEVEQAPVQPDKEAGAKTSSTPGKVAEKVSISPRAQDVSKIKQQLETVPDVRMDKVDRISKEIKEGTYNPPLDEVAEKMLTLSVLESLHRK